MSAVCCWLKIVATRDLRVPYACSVCVQYLACRDAAGALEGALEALPPALAQEWRATIAADMAAQASMPPQQPLSDAYLSGAPVNKSQGGLSGLFADGE